MAHETTTILTPTTACPTCKYELDAATAVCEDEPEVRPTKDDFSVCAKCGEILCFNEDLTQRIAELNDMMKLKDAEMKYLGNVQDQIRKTRPID